LRDAGEPPPGVLPHEGALEIIVCGSACIGRNVVIGAGSVVRGTVPDRCVVAGVPARVVRSYVPGDGWSPLARLPGALLAPSPPGGDPPGHGGLPALHTARPPVERVEGVAQPVDPPG
jgi:hypothetical protein